MKRSEVKSDAESDDRRHLVHVRFGEAGKCSVYTSQNMDVLNVKCAVLGSQEREKKPSNSQRPSGTTQHSIRIKKIEPLAVYAVVRASVITASIQNTLNFYKLLCSLKCWRLASHSSC